MSQRLSTSATFQSLLGRVGALEGDVANGFTPSGIGDALGFLPANRAGDGFMGQITAPGFGATNGPGAGAVVILPSFAAAHTGVIQFLKSDGNRNGYVGFNTDAGAMQYGSDTGAGHNFTGGPIGLDANFLIGMSGVNPAIIFDSGDKLVFDRSANKYLFYIGNALVASLDGSGNMRLAGTLTQSTTP